jgi:hypothetical protein
MLALRAYKKFYFLTHNIIHRARSASPAGGLWGRAPLSSKKNNYY